MLAEKQATQSLFLTLQYSLSGSDFPGSHRQTFSDFSNSNFFNHGFDNLASVFSVCRILWAAKLNVQQSFSHSHEILKSYVEDTSSTVMSVGDWAIVQLLVKIERESAGVKYSAGDPC